MKLCTNKIRSKEFLIKSLKALAIEPHYMQGPNPDGAAKKFDGLYPFFTAFFKAYTLPCNGGSDPIILISRIYSTNY